MPGLTDSLRILITANGAQAEREFSKVGASARRSLGQAEDSATRYSRTLTSAGVAMATFGAVALVGLGKAAQAAEEENAAHLRLQNTLANIPELAGANEQAFYDQASALQNSTKFADEATVAAQAMLGTFHLTEDQILELTPVVQDYAAKFGIDLVEASKQVGKAVEGQRGALQRNGVILDENAYAADHFSAVLDALKDNAGGFAEEEGKTLSGQLAILKNRFSDIAEAVGGGAASAFSDLLTPVTAVSDALKGMDPSTQALIGRLLTFGAVGITAAGGLAFAVGQLLKMKAAFIAVRDAAIVARVSTLAMSTSVGQGLALVAPQAAGVTAAVLASYIVLHDYIESLDEWEASTKQAASATTTFSNVLSNNGSVLDAVSTNVNMAIDAHGKLADAIHLSGMTASEFAEQIATTAPNDMGAVVTRIATAVQRAGGSYEDAQGAVTDFALAQDQAARGMIAAAVSAGRIDPVMSHNAIGAASAGQATRDYTGALQILMQQDPGAFDGLAESAETAAGAVEDLTQDIKDYLSQTFDVPDAQRALQQSFGDLQEQVEGLAGGNGSFYDVVDAQEDIVRATADLIDKQQQQGASQQELDQTIHMSIANLAHMRDQGIITGHQFDVMSGQIRAVPHQLSVPVSTPGSVQARAELEKMRANVDALNGRHVTIGVSLSGVDLARAQLAQLANPFHGESARSRRTVSPSRSRGGTSTITSTGPDGNRGGGSAIHVEVYGTATAADGQAVVDALKRWEQRNGPVPVKVSA